jgi:myo-inositol 2-dehydrogenase/D-chiro-inositol 1-dehydrogenase
MLNIGILGCGRIGRVHALSIRDSENARLAAVADANVGFAEAFSSLHGARAMEAEALISSPEVDAVVIASPTDTHFGYIGLAAAAGKPIFCEKPVDLSSEKTLECVAIVETAGVPFMTAFNRRFDANFSALRSRIVNGEIGEVELVMITSRDPTPPPVSYIERSGGIFRDMMIHDFDMARYLTGQDFTDVFATGAALIDSGIGDAGDVDTAAATLTARSGAICQISNSRRSPCGYDQRVEVHGSKGMIRAGNILEDALEVANERGFTKAPVQHFFLERYKAAYRAEMEHFISAVATGAKLSPGIQDGLAALLIADAASRSLATRALVSL